jgi:hypothetical protein
MTASSRAPAVLTATSTPAARGGAATAQRSLPTASGARATGTGLGRTRALVIRAPGSPSAGEPSVKLPLVPLVPLRGVGNDLAGSAASGHASGSPIAADAVSSLPARPDLEAFLLGVQSHAHARTPLLSLERPD